MGGVVSHPGHQAVSTGYSRVATIADVRQVADNMRQEDIDEVQAQSGMAPRESLLLAYMRSKPCHAMVSRSGAVIGLWGVVPEGDGVGRIWMLGTDGMVDDSIDRKTFLRLSIKYLEELHQQFAVLFNEIDARNTVHLEWLRRMGFTFVRYHSKYGVEGRPFYEFCRMSHV